MEKIFINVVALLEEELKPTIKDFLANASDPSRLHFSIVVQDTEDPESWLKELMKFYKATMSYKFLKLEDVRGVGHARALAQEPLTPDYDYYLQIDGHSRSSEEWDNRLIQWYNTEGWDVDGKFIYSTYPKTYGYVSDLPSNIDLQAMVLNKDQTIYYQNDGYNDTSGDVTVTKYTKTMMKFESKGDGVEDYHYETVRVPFAKDLVKRNHQVFCAGFVFGRTEHFLDIPYDPNFSYTGEELTMAIRLFKNNVKIIEPYENLLYHDYEGHAKGRRPSWFAEQDDKFDAAKEIIPFMEFEKASAIRLSLFLDGHLDEQYGVSKEIVKKFYQTYAL